MAVTWNILVGAETGLLKGINVHKKCWENLNTVENVAKENEVNQICWANDEQTAVCLATRKGVVSEVDLHSRKITRLQELDGDRGPFRGLARHKDYYITCTRNGSLEVWKPGKSNVVLNAGPDIYKMRHNPQASHLVATGGKENDLKVFDVSKKEPVFTAKNVRHNWLELRVPVWVTDMAFLPDTDKIVTCTGHHQVRLYDTKSQRRPVLDFEVEEHPLTSLSLRNGYNEIVVGNTIGTMALLDIRKGGLVHKFPGFAGSISDLYCHPTEPVVVSCSQDRFARVHDINSKHLLNKFYMKSRLNCLLLTDQWTASDPANQDKEDKLTNDSEDENMTDQSDSDKELWDSLNVVETKKLKRKPKHYHIEDEKKSRMAKGDTSPRSDVKVAKKRKIKKAKSKGE